MPCADASSAAFPRDGASAKRSCISGEPGPKPRQRHPTNPAARRRLAATARGGRFRGTQTGMLHGMPWSARCVQRFDDSRNSAIHITYRVSLRSSSMGEPRDPLSKVVLIFGLGQVDTYRYKDELVGEVCPRQHHSAQGLRILWVGVRDRSPYDSPGIH